MNKAAQPSKRQQAKRSAGASPWHHYEQIKQTLTAAATTPAEYDAACRRAAEIAGV